MHYHWFFTWHGTPCDQRLWKFARSLQSSLYVSLEGHQTKVPAFITAYHFHSIIHSPWLFCLGVNSGLRSAFLYASPISFSWFFLQFGQKHWLLFLLARVSFLLLGIFSFQGILLWVFPSWCFDIFLGPPERFAFHDLPVFQISDTADWRQPTSSATLHVGLPSWASFYRQVSCWRSVSCQSARCNGLLRSASSLL